MSQVEVALLVCEGGRKQEYAKHALSSMLFAVSEINAAGGIDNKKLVSKVYQSKDQLEFKYDVEQALARDTIKALFVSAPSSYRMAVSEMIAQAQKALFYTDSFEGLRDEKHVFYLSSTLQQRLSHLVSWIVSQKHKRILLVWENRLLSKLAFIYTKSLLKDVDAVSVYDYYEDKKVFNESEFLDQLEDSKATLVCSFLEDALHEQLLYSYCDKENPQREVMALFIEHEFFESIKIPDLKHYLLLEKQNPSYMHTASYRSLFAFKAWYEQKASLEEKAFDFSCEGEDFSFDNFGYCNAGSYIYRYDTKRLSEIVSKEKKAPLPWLGVEELDTAYKDAVMALMQLFPDYDHTLTKLGHIANFDVLTGLYNRDTILSHIRHALGICKRYRQEMALLIFDLDNFKKTNDTFGLAFGDQLLKSVAKRIKKSLRETDLMARLGGDEFAILVENVHNRYELITLTEKLLKLFHEAFIIEEQKIYITASFGIARYPYDGDKAETLLKNADIAMYEAKENGKDGFAFFFQRHSPYNKERLILENDLHDACTQEQLELFFQPQVRSTDQYLVGAEALIRWNHPTQGRIEPVEFLPIADEAGLMYKIDLWVIEEVFKRIQAWQQEQQPIVPIAVNISNALFHHKSFITSLEQFHLKYPDIAPFIDLELTEHIMMKDPDETLEKVLKMKSFGFSISIDDFGTGYSSLSHLKHLPIGKLKIDRSFIKDIVENENDEAIVKAIISMAQSLNMNVIAEGVDKTSQVNLLNENDCHQIQGFFYSKPLSLSEFNKMWLSKHRKL